MIFSLRGIESKNVDLHARELKYKMKVIYRTRIKSAQKLLRMSEIKIKAEIVFIQETVS